LKGSRQVCGLRGRRRGLQRRLIDEKTTREFGHYVALLPRARAGDSHIEGQLIAHGKVAQVHFDQLLLDAAGMRSVFNVLAKAYTKEERALLLSDEPFTQEMVNRLSATLLDIVGSAFLEGTLSTRLPSSDELPNTFLFRFGLCLYLLAIRRGAQGGVAETKPERVRNDIVDMTFAAYATYFDGVLSNDASVNRVHSEARAMLVGLFKAEVPGLVWYGMQ
jgi:hypothetical protein